jgi:hypothetical protein
MKAAHLENEINPFASAFCAPYAWSSRKGHWLRSLPLLLEMSIGRGRPEKSVLSKSMEHVEFKSGKRIDYLSALPYSSVVPGELLVLSRLSSRHFPESLI